LSACLEREKDSLGKEEDRKKRKDKNYTSKKDVKISNYFLVRNGATHEDTFTIELIFSADPENVHKLMVTDYNDLLEYIARLQSKKRESSFQPCNRLESKYNSITMETDQLKMGHGPEPAKKSRDKAPRDKAPRDKAPRDKAPRDKDKKKKR